MESVEPRNDEERRSKLRNAPRIVRQPRAFVDEMRPLVGLAPQEYQPSGNRQPEKADRQFRLPRPGGSDSHGHHRAARDQSECHKRDQDHVEDFGLFRPLLADAPDETVGDQKSGKRQSVGDNEDPHHELAPGGAERRFPAAPI